MRTYTYIINRSKLPRFVGPFVLVYGSPWDTVRDANGLAVSSVSFNGNAKQRRQGRRELLRLLNGQGA